MRAFPLKKVLVGIQSRIYCQTAYETILKIMSKRLPSKPAPPRFEKPVPEHAKQLPPKLRIDANFEGVSNMKVKLIFLLC